jgi:DNA-binding transcriptional MerR regulator
MNLISIGKFSRLTGLSIRALRLYDSEGILEPNRIDSDTGYRYYTHEQIKLAEQIKLLRECEMPLGVILQLLKYPNEKSKCLLEHRQFLEKRLNDHRLMLRKLNTLIDQTMPVFTVDLRFSRLLYVIRISQQIIWEEPGQRAIIGKLMGELFHFVRANQIKTNGSPFCMFPMPFPKLQLELKACMSITDLHPNQEPFEFTQLPPVQLAYTIHYGEYSTLPQTLEKLALWISDHHYEIIGDVRETYLEHPLSVPEPDQYRTEIAVPIQKQA